MKFVALGVHERIPSNSRRGVCYLATDRWDDYHFKTLFYLTYLGADRNKQGIGSVKIGGRGWDEDQFSPVVPDRFEELGGGLFLAGPGRRLLHVSLCSPRRDRGEHLEGIA